MTKGANFGACKSCGAEIRWAVSVNGRNMPLDAKPVQVYRLRTELDGREIAEHAGELYQSHFATCPNAGEHRGSRK